MAGAPRDGYTVYWLGRDFAAGGLTFEGPGVPDFGAEVEGGGVAMSYTAKLPEGGGVSLDVALYSDAAWRRIGGDARPLPKNAITKSVTVNGSIGELLLVPAGTRPVNTTRLTLRLGDTTVFIAAGAGGPVTPGGPDANPLIDEQTFLSVVQQLRPYPQ